MGFAKSECFSLKLMITAECRLMMIEVWHNEWWPSDPKDLIWRNAMKTWKCKLKLVSVQNQFLGNAYGLTLLRSQSWSVNYGKWFKFHCQGYYIRLDNAPKMIVQILQTLKAIVKNIAHIQNCWNLIMALSFCCSPLIIWETKRETYINRVQRVRGGKCDIFCQSFLSFWRTYLKEISLDEIES